MDDILTLLKNKLIQRLPIIIFMLFLGGVGLTVLSGLDCRKAQAFNLDYDTKALIKKPNPDDPGYRAYAMGYLYALQGDTKKAIHYLTLAEADANLLLSAQSKFALGNLYFAPALQSADIQSGEGHIQGVAQIELAREAYKGALRLNPELWAARYNLELLDRLSPPKRYEGWERETDGVTLAPQKRDGWASMRDNTRRGLP